MLHSRRLGLTVLLDVWRFFPRGQSIRKLAYKPNKYKAELNKVKNEMAREKEKARKKVRTRKKEKARTKEFRTNEFQTNIPIRSIYIQRLYVPQDGLSATQTWTKIIGNRYPVVPRYIFIKDFPAGFLGPDPSPSPRGKRTPDDKKRVECVMKVYITSLEQYITPEMVQSIKQAPYYMPDEDVIVFKSHQHLTQVKNGRQCEKNCSLFIRNVASEILYRQFASAADESANSKVDGEGEGKQRSPPIVVSHAQTRSMGYNWKKPFRTQMRQYRDKINRERSKASALTEKENED